VSVFLPLDLLQWVDKKRGVKKRSKFIREKMEEIKESEEK